MKLIIVSDSHGSFGGLKKIVEREAPFNLLLHLGDGLEELARLGRIIDFQYDGVNGNNGPLFRAYPSTLPGANQRS
jgi:predicted phosphodiesterase